MLLGIGAALAVWWPEITFGAGLIPVQSPYLTRFSTVDVGRVMSPTRPKGDRLVIPRIGLDTRIIEASPPLALAEGVYHYPETADPGEAGNAVIAGHRIREVFTLLHVLKAGDPIIVYWHGGENDYRVVRKFEVEPTDVSILSPSPTEELTLYTCIPRSAGNRRTVVIAAPVTP